LDAERSYQQARLGFVRAVVQRYLDTVQLFLALGGTSPSAPVAAASGQSGDLSPRPRASLIVSHKSPGIVSRTAASNDWPSASVTSVILGSGRETGR
jgi:hypothetical protein